MSASKEGSADHSSARWAFDLQYTGAGIDTERVARA